MPDAKHHQTQTISQKYSLDYYRRPLSTRVWKSPWNWTFLAIALATVGALYAARRDATFQAAPVSDVHSMFANNCSACHVDAWKPAQRMVSFSDAHHSVTDAACQKCHQAAKHTTLEKLDEPACASCHQEHRPGQSLTDLADSSCTQCHCDLSNHKSATAFHSVIARFGGGDEGHPEFAVLKNNEADRSGLKFNHQHHLDPSKILDPETRKPLQLTCADCHVANDDGAYMKPIVYEAHCANCHPLRPERLPSELGELPHASAEQVRGVLRERLAQILEKRDAPQSNRPLPLLPAPARLTADQERRLETAMRTADHAVFGPEAKGMCIHCHYVEQREGKWHAPLNNPALATSESSKQLVTMVPERWLHHGSFNHQAHRAVACDECHDAENSDKTADILLPTIATCRKCHGSEAETPTTKVRDNCTMCHTYHKENHSFPGVPLEQIFASEKLPPSEPTAR